MNDTTGGGDRNGPATTVPATLETTLERQRSAFLRDAPPDAASRRDRLSRPVAILKDHAREIIDAPAAFVPPSSQ